MKDSSEGTDGDGRLAEPRQRTPVSARKLKANRENARKSTGPKTSRGKAFSRLNAVKHGLFLSSATDFEGLLENQQEYKDLLNGLRGQYQPAGRAEEVEVERIAQCWWRLKRASRYENATNLIARSAFGKEELAEREKLCKEQRKTDDARLLQLQIAKKEMEDKGEISLEVKQRIFALIPWSEQMWLDSDKKAREHPEDLWCTEDAEGREDPVELRFSRSFEKLEPEVRSGLVAYKNIEILIAGIEGAGKQRSANLLEAAIGQYMIPSSEALDRLVRYETTIERSLARAQDRLYRLQKGRGGEWIAPPLTGRLTQ